MASVQPYFFPYLGYFHLLAAVDRVYLYDLVPFTSGGWVNRNRVMLRDGSVHWLTVPVRHSYPYRPIRETALDGGAWHKRLVSTIHSNYRRSPFYDEAFPVVSAALDPHATSIGELCVASVLAVARHLDLPTEIVTDSAEFTAIEGALVADHPADHPLAGTAGALDTKTRRLIMLCQRAGAREYVNPIGGQALYSKEAFAHHGIALSFVQSTLRPYRQPSAEFVPGLSIIDLLMRCGREGTRERLADYTLV
jgi:hypothetical protein